jgi:hypothetical protein
MSDGRNRLVEEPAKQVVVSHDVDVACVGGGVSGIFAALGAAEEGAHTVLVDRFGYVGGNIGPGMICQGHLASGQPHPKAPHQAAVYPGFMGLAKEFIERHAAAGGGCIPPFSTCHYPRDSGIASHTAMKMLEERNVELILSAYAADPIMEGRRVVGVFYEGKSGRRAIRAGVVVDATGEADVARRAGAPTLYPKQEYHELDGHSPTGMGLSFVVGGVDWDVYEEFVRTHPPTEEDLAWAREHLGEEKAAKHSGSGVLSAMRKSWEAGEYDRQEIVLGDEVISTKVSFGRIAGEDTAWGLASPARVEALNIGDAAQISRLESKLRAYVFEHVQVYRRHVPGFERAYLLTIAPFIGARGGPCVEGEYTLTMQDCREARRFDDVIYLYGEFRALRYNCERGECRWTDMPYRVMVPKKVEGLLCVGRSASGRPDTLLRNRMAVKHMGEAGGVAAALCTRMRVAPRDLDLKVLQQALLRRGFYLGDPARLRELGLT